MDGVVQQLAKRVPMIHSAVKTRSSGWGRTWQLLMVAGILLGAMGMGEAMAADGELLWEQGFFEPEAGELYGGHVAVAPNGTIVAVAHTFVFGTPTYGEFLIMNFSRGGAPIWTNRYYDTLGLPPDEIPTVSIFCGATAVAVAPNGNVFVTGYTGSGESCDYVTLAYTGAGVPMWTNRYHGPGSTRRNQAVLAAADPAGNVVVSGLSFQNAANTIVTIKYSGAGVAQWTNSILSPDVDAYPSRLVTDAAGNVILTGYGYRSTGPNTDYLTVMYSPSGTKLWTARYNGPVSGQPDNASDVAVDANGKIFVTGISGYGSTGAYATIAYANNGVPLWTNRYDPSPTGEDRATGVAVDPSGNVFVTGFAWNGTTYDTATLAYSNAGTPLWTNRVAAASVSWPLALSPGVRVDTSGAVIVNASDDNGFVVVAYSNAGVPLWTNRFVAYSSSGTPAAVAVDNDGSAIVGARYLGGYMIHKYLIKDRVAPNIAQEPGDQMALYGTNVTFAVNANGGSGPLRYQWLRDDVELPGETNAVLSVAHATGDGTYSVVVTGQGKGVTSRLARLVVAHSFFQAPVARDEETIHAQGFAMDLLLEAGRAFRVQASTNLLNWVDLTNFTSSGTAFQFIDLAATNSTRRFYRVVSP